MRNALQAMLNFGKLYDIISDEEKKSLITYLIKEIQIYPNGESEQPLKSIEFNFPIYRDGQEVRRLLWEKGNTVEYVTLLPKSITTAIGMGVSEELGGYVTLTVAMIIITGIFGNVIAVSVCRLFRITDPIAKGVSIGSAAHALGTAKALEIGEVEGAMSSLSIVVAGLLTVVGASIFANLM